jgi:hypothetical protein
VATKAVAARGDVSAEAGTTPSSKADSGTWTAGPVSVTTFDDLTVGGDPVVVEAECTFTFSGTKGNSAVADSATVTLTAADHPLLGTQDSVLVHGDEESDTYGNKVSVSSTRDLRTA